MNCFSYLKKRIPLYIISGALLGCAVLTLTVAHKYDQYLSAVLEDLNRISTNKSRVKKQVLEIDRITAHFRDQYKTDVMTMNTEAMMFRALDIVKKDLHDARINVRAMVQTGAGSELPVEIEAPMASYRMILEYIDYMDSFRLPNYKIKRLTITEEQEERVVLNLQGVFLMPPA